MFSLVKLEPRCGPTLLLKILILNLFESTLPKVAFNKVTALLGKWSLRKKTFEDFLKYISMKIFVLRPPAL